jgi:hypothetical protein
VTEQRTYRFDVLDRTGVFLGFGLAQLLLLGLGAMASTLAVSAGLPVPVAVAPVLAALGLATGRVRGERLIDWVPVGLRWVVERRHRRWFTPLELRRAEAEHPRRLELPPFLAGVELLAVDVDGGVLAGACIVHDASTASMSAALRVRGSEFALAGRDDQVRLLAGWGDLVSAFATERGTVARLTWSDFTTAAGMKDHEQWLTQHASSDTAAARSYRELLDTTGALSTGHEFLVTITVSRDRLPPGGRTRDLDAHLREILGQAVETLARGLRSAELFADPPLTVAEVSTALRRRLDPTQPERASGGALAERLGLVQAGNAGPMVTEIQWSHLRTDGAWHRTYWIAEWPRLAQHPDWMQPLLAFPGVGSRSLTVILEPVAPSAARRRIDRDAIRLDTDASTRSDRGRRVGAGHRRLQSEVVEREAELVAGYAEVAYAGLVTVTAADEARLQEASEQVEHVAREHGLELRSLDGRQDVAFAAALPLGLGLARTWLS